MMVGLQRTLVFTAALIGTVGVSDARVRAVASQPQSEVMPIGSFASESLGLQHTYGYEVQLWHDGPGTVIGLLVVSHGISDIVPTAKIENVTYNEQTGEVAFNAELPIDLAAMCQQFRFVGHLGTNELTGTLEWVALRRPDLGPSIESLRLLRTSTLLPAFVSLGEWEQSTADRIRLSGTCPGGLARWEASLTMDVYGHCVKGCNKARPRRCAGYRTIEFGL
jgi:hypothetical protein